MLPIPTKLLGLALDPPVIPGYVAGGCTRRSNRLKLKQNNPMAEQNSSAMTGPPSPQTAMTREAAAQLAHELRTPISAIISTADLMAEERFGPLGDPRYKGYMAGIRSSARHLLDVVEAMMSNAIDRPSREVTSLQGAAEATIEHMQVLAEGNRSNIQLEVDAVPRMVGAAPTALRQILLNLLANSVKYAGLDASIVIRTGSDPDGACWVEVEDDGPGLPPAIAAGLQPGINSSIVIEGAARIAAMTGSPATHPKAPGETTTHGFGLTISVALAKANGAVLEFHPASPHGTRARLTFQPLAATSVAVAE